VNPTVTDADLPALFRAADLSSLRAQARFLLLTRAQLVAFIVAAAAGVATWKAGTANITAVIAAAAFVTAVVLQAEAARTKPERLWYDGRAVAESAKTAAWRYAVGGNPFGLSLSTAEAEQELVATLRELPVGLQGVQFLLGEGDGDQITPWMRETRHSPLETRRGVYDAGRIADEQAWYSRMARWNGRAAERWGRVLLAAEAGGVVAAVARAAGALHVDLASLAAAAAAAVTAWLQTKQHESLAAAYAVASLELSAIRALIAHVETEDGWAQFVGEAEEAISREHTMWKTSRSVRR
jgi:hypothetical protein